MGLPDLTSLIAFDDRLRMVPTDRAALALAVDALTELARWDRSDSPGPAVLRRLGVGLIALGRAEQAIPVLGRAVALAVASADRHAEVAARINLGDGHRYAGDAMAAQEQYGLALGLARRLVPELVDFALQHLGKGLIDLGRYAEATACLTEALRLRRAKGDPALVASTNAALRLARATPAG